MAGFFSKLKEKFSTEETQSKKDEESYVELGSESGDDVKSKVIVRSYVLEDFEQIKSILDALREGKTIALINIKPLRDKDLIELKRAINKLKKTCDAIEGDIAGFGDDWIAATPSFASIYRKKDLPQEEEQESVKEVTEYTDEA